MPRKKASDMEPEEVMARPPRSGGFGKVILVGLLLLFAIAFVWFFVKYQQAKQQVNHLSTVEGQQELNQAEIDQVIQEVGRHIVLPEGETPTLATIEDAESLAKEQPFFANATNGDKVLIYSDRAFIYNTDKDILVNVGPVYFQGATSTTSTEDEQAPAEETQEPEVQKVSLDIRNGSDTSGVAQNLANSLLAQGSYDVANVANAANKDYTDTVLVNLGGQDVSALENILGVTAVDALPEGEADSSADVVIILGNNQ